jgi:integrase
MLGKLTPLQLKNAKPGRLADGNGLYLLVKDSGAKSWVLRVQYAGRRRDLGIGPLSLVSLSEAREKAREWRKLAKSGIDPTAETKRRRALPTFEEVARRYHETVKDGWRNTKHRAQWLSTLERYAFPCIGSTRVDQVDAADIQSLLLPIWRLKPETARRVRQRVATVLNYSKAQGWRTTEAPMRAVNTLLNGLKQPKGTNFAAMPYRDVPAFLTKIRGMVPTTARTALQFAIHTACRSGELRHATFGEIDWAGKQWNIPAHRMKAGEAHSVPLSPEALSILETRRDASGDRSDALLFPGLNDKPMSDMTLTKALRAAGASDFTVHGFRSSFRDWVAEATSHPGDWAEAALAHKVQNKTEAAYRRTKYLIHRIGLMNEWSKFITGFGFS